MRMPVFRAGLLMALAAAMTAATGAVADSTETAAPAVVLRSTGPVTGLPLPRFVSLKTSEGNARRGPGLDHRIDWVFTRPGMPLRITAEYEHWRRVEDAEGAGGWVHYSLLSGNRTVLVTEDLAAIHARPDPRSEVVARAEIGVVAAILECLPAWCRISREGQRGWMAKGSIWGVGADETVD